MEKEFWLERWEKQQIGFHLSDVNKNLLKYFESLGVAKGSCLFVPLCGKSLDMLWLVEQGYKVVGVELSEIAIKDFFKENNLFFEVSSQGKFKKYQTDNITLLQGDIFDLHCDDLPGIDAIYDRAATIALPETIRIKYLEKLKEFGQCFNTLMVLLEYDQSKVDGPPFSVSEDFLYTHMQGFDIEKLKEEQVENIPPRFQEQNLTVKEKVFLIRSGL